MRCSKISPFWILSIVIVISSTVSAGPEEKQIALVNGTVITEDEYLRELDRYLDRLKSMGQSLDEMNMSEIKKAVIENIIGMILMYQKSREEGITVEKDKIDSELKNLKAQYPDEKSFQELLEQHNISEEIIKTQIVQGIAIQKFIKQQFIDQTSITDSEVKSFYDNNPDQFKRPETVKASHILIKLDPEADEDQRKTAKTTIEKIETQIKSGEDFASLAKQYSQGPSSEKGGDLGYFGRGDMVKPFEDAAFALKPGDVSDIVETEFGYHLIKATDKQKAGSFIFDEIKVSLKRYLKEMKVQKNISEYVIKLRAGADVKIF
ncbi:peptidylprolyl isomerase [Thermodesulfobacteriota bacterium]